MDIQRILKENYGFIATQIKPILSGVGGETYLVCRDTEKYVLKIVCTDQMSHPETEEMLCRHLLQKGINVPRYITTLEGKGLVTLGKHAVVHLQTYLEGATYPVNSAPGWLLEESADMLARIHIALRDFGPLPTGIGKDFLQYMAPERATLSYKQSLQKAKERNEKEIISDLEYRVDLMEHFPDLHFEMDRLTCCNTHGDYTINQLICGNDSIKGVVDWTCACIHPVIWELTRSYVYAARECREGTIDFDSFHHYIDTYEKKCPLSTYDKDNLLNLYFYQIGVCDYYWQYLNAGEKDKDEFRWQARFATCMLKFLYKYITTK